MRAKMSANASATSVPVKLNHFTKVPEKSAWNDLSCRKKKIWGSFIWSQISPDKVPSHWVTFRGLIGTQVNLSLWEKWKGKSLGFCCLKCHNWHRYKQSSLCIILRVPQGVSLYKLFLSSVTAIIYPLNTFFRGGVYPHSQQYSSSMTRKGILTTVSQFIT